VFFIPGQIIAALTFPGVIIHEFDYNQGLASSPRIGKRQKLGTLTETATHLSLGEHDV
jgi:hypothetical protein